MAPPQQQGQLEFSLDDVVSVEPITPPTASLEFSLDDVVAVAPASEPRERMYVPGSPEIGPLPRVDSPLTDPISIDFDAVVGTPNTGPNSSVDAP